MKTMKKTAAAGIALAATAGLVAGPVMMTGQAWAVETGEVTITAKDPNSVVDYKAFCIFTGKVGTDKKLSDIAWANDAVKTAVCAELGITETDADSAQKAADAISKMQADVTSHSSALMSLARAIDVASVSFTTIEQGKGTALPETGYYMFVTKSFPEDVTDNASTAPIFQIIGTDGLNITEKTSVPTVTKTVKDDDADKADGKRADANIGQKLTFTLDGTLPSDFDAYNTYYYAFHDTMDGFDTVEETDVVVKVDGTVVTDGYTVTVAAGKLDVVFNDIKQVTGAAAGKHVTVEYQAKLAANATIAGEGNTNKVYIEYSNNPNKDEKGTTTEDDAKVYSYALKINKVDSLNAATKLEGAHFQVLDSAGTVVLEGDTDENGILEFKGLDTGTYTIKETKAPDGYQLAADFQVTITDSSPTAAAPAIAVSKGENTPQADVDENTGEVTVRDDSMLLLPVTGMNGIVLCTLVGGAVIVASSISIARSRKSNQED